jgi:seryl-tRNA synthetase
MLKIWEEERNNYVSEIEQLQGYVNQLQTQLKTEKQQYDKYTSETTPKINQLEHSLKTLQSNSGKTQK